MRKPLKIDNKTTFLTDLDLPKTLYKYRTWSDPFHKRVLTHKEIYFAAPSSFDDPLDCKFPIRYDTLTDEQIFNCYFTRSKEDNPNWSYDQHYDFALKWLEIGLLRNSEHIENETKKQFEIFDSHIGILSLSANSANDDLWRIYGDRHKGIAYGFDPYKLFEQFGGGGEVIYNEDIPLILPRPFHSFDEQNQMQIFHKLNKWTREEEYRTYIFESETLTNATRTRLVPVEGFKEIVLGSQVPSEWETEIRDLVNSEFSKINIRKL